MKNEVIDAASPKSMLRYCREIGILSDEEATVLQMADDRNLSVHTHNEPLAVKIHHRFQQDYVIGKTIDRYWK